MLEDAKQQLCSGVLILPIVFLSDAQSPNKSQRDDEAGYSHFLECPLYALHPNL